MKGIYNAFMRKAFRHETKTVNTNTVLKTKLIIFTYYSIAYPELPVPSLLSLNTNI